MKTVCVVGGGNLAHATIGVWSALPDIEIRLLTNHPEKWNGCFKLNTPEGKVLDARISRISSDAAEVVPGADIVFLCLPAFCVEDAIVRIKPYISEESVVGTVVANSGFFIFCHRILPRSTRLFGFQRVPFVARIVQYAREVNLLGYRDELIMATENIDDRESFRRFIEYIFNEKTSLTESFYEVTLSNSNPILHTGRLYTMLKDWDGKPFDRCPLFYREWTDEASELEIAMDREFFELLGALKVDTAHIDTLLEHYEACDAAGMTAKLRSIESLSTIQAPMVQTGAGWMPDFNSRYFTEDFPFGLRMIVELAKEKGVPAPNLEKVYEWGRRVISDRA